MNSKTVLVCEDMDTDRRHLVNVLQRNGYRTAEATDGTQAIELARALKPDLILMDVVMPGIDGFAATREIVQNAETAHIPVVICSSKSQGTDKKWGRLQGARDYVTKPIDERALLAAIEAAGLASE